MRKLFIVLAAIFAVLGVVFAFLPLGTLGLLPIGLALIFGFIVLRMSDETQKRMPKVILVIAILSLAGVVGKEVFIKDEVEVDKQFEQKKIESEKEAKKDLEELEGLE
jgi:glucose dehydrogenase